MHLTEVRFWYKCISLKLGSGKKIDQKAISNLDFIEELLQSSSENDNNNVNIIFIVIITFTTQNLPEFFSPFQIANATL